MAVLTVVHHSPTASVRSLTDAVVEGATHPDLEGAVTVVAVPAATADAGQVRQAHGVVLVTPVNLGYISGALKDFFDRSFRDLEGRSDRLPFGAVIKGTTDATGALRAIAAITTGLSWREACGPVVLEGEVEGVHLAAARELGATLAAALLL